MKQLNTILSSLMLLGSVIGASALLLAPAHPRAQQIDPDEAAIAKAAAGRDALAHFLPDAAASVGTFIKFDVPGAAKGTNPAAINALGVITGSYTDANRVAHGFLRSPFGIQKFDVPGAANGTTPYAINAAGSVAGIFSDNSGTHGFVRSAFGGYAKFDIPGDGNFIPWAINAAGEVAGQYFDANSVGHGFFRNSGGRVIVFDVPGSGQGFLQGTYPRGIGPDGVIVGLYVDADSVGHIFLRNRDGTFATFDPPGNIRPFIAFSFGANLYINEAGVIVGSYFQNGPDNPFGGNWQIFIRSINGGLVTFNAANYPPCCIWSFPTGIAPNGTITGSLNDGFTVNHGFLRHKDGSVVTFDVPGASTTPASNLGTVPLGITPDGEIMGEYFDTNRIAHGFVLLPTPKMD